MAKWNFLSGKTFAVTPHYPRIWKGGAVNGLRKTPPTPGAQSATPSESGGEFFCGSPPLPTLLPKSTPVGGLPTLMARAARQSRPGTFTACSPCGFLGVDLLVL